MLRNWIDIFRLYFSSSPLYDVSALLDQDEYQSDSGNLPHIHLICSIK